ncbi:general odorant-binding protein 19d [Tribolium castaneum]|uniref:Odorant binding protein 15 n=1 Tax=Tribolium castaneum TaxID=7070 RepID=D7ELE9_TRICA|nr:PREDICTED: general odorant-binding protein 19d [Tribolium castaneum]EFA12066.1 odorant binding protein 15 [Tribolium castaneum]|eukprot:XP_008200270.1 PREDICTED: general odorant-binding protein 19d [Tribolium castaneum]
MNCFVIFALSLSATVFGQSLSEDEMRENARKLMTSCKDKVGASDADVEALKMHQMPESREGFCMLECVFDSAKIMQDGKFSKSGMIEGFKPLIGDDKAKLESLEKLSATCESELGDGEDKCETAKRLVECVIKNGKTHGFEVPPPRE